MLLPLCGAIGPLGRSRRRTNAAAPPVEITVPIAADGDDGTYFFIWYSDTTGALGMGAVQGSSLGFHFWSGFRFIGVAVPTGATIVSATISFSVTSSEGASFGNMRGVDADDAPEWSGTHHPFNASGTTALVALTSANMTAVDVTSIVQEIVGRPGWSSGNAIAFYGDDGAADGESVSWNDFSANDGPVAELGIVYVVG